MGPCRATKANGEACRAPATGPDGWCWAHAPEHAEKRRRMASKAAKAKPNRELRDIKARLSALADDVLEGKADRGNAAVASQVLNVYLRAVSVELKVTEQRELIERIERLESQRGGKTRWG